jgi:flagellar FliL protein
MAENIKEDEQPAAKAAQGQSKLVPIILVANTLLMGGVLAIVLLRKPNTAVAIPTAAAGQASATAAGEGKGAGEGAKSEGGHGEGGGHENAPADQPGAPGPILKLENFIIQLRGTDTDRYVRVAFDLELMSEADRGLVQARMSHIRDAVISYFSDRSLDELRGSEGMERIKLAVAKKLDDILSAHRVRSVFITELVIQ